MNRAITGLSLALLVSWPATAANWYSIKGGGPQEADGETYIDLSSIEPKAGFILAWIKHEYVKDQHIIEGDPTTYRTVLRRYAFNCLEKEMAVTAAAFYEGEMGFSRLLYTKSFSREKWKFQLAVPNTAGFDWLSYACKFVPKRSRESKGPLPSQRKPNPPSASIEARHANEYCKGVALAEVAMMTTLLRYPDGALSLETWKNFALVQATKVSGMADVTRLGLTSHINNFTEQHRVQMAAMFQRSLVENNSSRKQLLETIEPTIPDLMREKFFQCRGELSQETLIK